MVEVKRGKGRPVGSEMDDSQILDSVADAIFSNPVMRPTTAMKKQKRQASEAEIRRWQAKWRDRKHALLDAAKLRAETCMHRPVASSGGIPAGRNLLDEICRGYGYANSFGLGSYNSKVLQAALGESQAMRTMGEILKNKDLIALHALANNPFEKMVREQRDILKHLSLGRF